MMQWNEFASMSAASPTSVTSSNATLQSKVETILLMGLPFAMARRQPLALQDTSSKCFDLHGSFDGPTYLSTVARI